jgi:carbamoyltransferase
MPIWLKRKLWTSRIIEKAMPDFGGDILFSSHHLSHAASAYYCSPFEEAVVVTVDGVGEWATCTLAIGSGKNLEIIKEIRFPHSLGLLYSTITGYLGFRINSGEYKVMGLAPFGNPTYVEALKRVIQLRKDGSFTLDMSFFSYVGGLRMHSRRLKRLLGIEPRSPDDPIAQVHKDLAFSLQVVTEEALLGLVNAANQVGTSQNICLAGGVALNCVANGRVLREGPFKKMYIQPAAGDAGGAVGAAAYVAHSVFDEPRCPPKHVFWGPSFDSATCRAFLESKGIPFQEFTGDALYNAIIERLRDQQVIGFFQGRMEFGPRALGHRSILADPRSDLMRNRVNSKIKFREAFRPFAPAGLEEKATHWFDLSTPSPYMLVTGFVLPERRDQIPAVTHVNGSARVQTVNSEDSPRFHRLLTLWDQATDCPVLLNTSFNIRGEPIVCTPEDAYACFRGSGLDALAIGDFLLDKADMPEDSEWNNYAERFAPD